MDRFQEKAFQWEKRAKNAFTWNAENFLQNKKASRFTFFSYYDILKKDCRRGGMVDTTDSKSVARKGVRVQVSLPAFFHIKTKYPNRLHFFYIE